MKVTVELFRKPVPLMVSVCAAAPAASEPGDSVTMSGTGLLGGATVTDAVPDLVESCVDVAVTVAVPVVAGVKTPALLTAPMLAGLTDQVTDVLKLPVPITVGAQVDVCVVRIDAGEQTTVTEVMVIATVTVTVPEPDLVESSVDVAVMVAVPAAEGVNTPAEVIAPSVADQVTTEL